MTSWRQLEANRRNSRSSTGPRTEQGKQRSRQNTFILRHGLTAETVVDVLEDPAAYRAFETQVLSDYLPTSTIERELVTRLASLLWRLRRATAIETGLLQIHAEILSTLNGVRETKPSPDAEDDDVISSPCAFPPHTEEDRHWAFSSSSTYLPHPSPNLPSASAPLRRGAPVKLAQCFLRLSNFDNGLFERIGRYETAVWRQVGQTFLTLQAVRKAR
jgi:hypothetical protein